MCSAQHGDKSSQIKGALKHILEGNSDFVKTHRPDYFSPFVMGQNPMITVVSCSDSRVQMHAIDSTPDNHLFVVRNIGNQFATAEGSIEYGVHHLHTPVLLIMGHVRCGAIKAATGDYSSESAPIKKELDTIKIKKGGDILENVRINVNNQVAAAVEKFRGEVKAGKLAVVGAIYDFANDLQGGHGKLHIINVNGETDPKTVAESTGEFS